MKKCIHAVILPIYHAVLSILIASTTTTPTSYYYCYNGILKIQTPNVHDISQEDYLRNCINFRLTLKYL